MQKDRKGVAETRLWGSGSSPTPVNQERKTLSAGGIRDGHPPVHSVPGAAQPSRHFKWFNRVETHVPGMVFVMVCGEGLAR